MKNTSQPPAAGEAAHTPTPFEQWIDARFPYGKKRPTGSELRLLSDAFSAGANRGYQRGYDAQIAGHGNSHAALVEALEAFVYKCENTENEEVCGYFATGAGKPAYLKARAALAAAKEGKP